MPFSKLKKTKISFFLQFFASGNLFRLSLLGGGGYLLEFPPTEKNPAHGTSLPRWSIWQTLVTMILTMNPDP